MNTYSQDLRNKVIELYKSGKSIQEIIEMLQMCQATVYKWVKQYKETGKCEIIKPVREGRKRLFTDEELVLKYLQEHPDANSKEMREALAPQVSIVCFYNSLKRMGFSYKKKSLVIKKDAKRREPSIGSWSLK